MGKKVRVTRVTLEYAFEGQLFSVDFPDPSKIGSIVFSKIDLDRLQTQQKAETGDIPPHPISPTAFPAEHNNALVSAVNKAAGTTDMENGTANRSLWWHTDSCSWFHPDGDLSSPT